MVIGAAIVVLFVEVDVEPVVPPIADTVTATAEAGTARTAVFTVPERVDELVVVVVVVIVESSILLTAVRSSSSLVLVVGFRFIRSCCCDCCWWFRRFE